MMKSIKIVPMLIMVSLVFASGCFIQSLHPFYTDKTKIAIPPHIVGHWMPTDADGGENEGEAPWLFSDGKITSHHKVGEKCHSAVYFKVKDVLFVDVEAGESTYGGDEDDTWLNAHRLSVHQVYKVVTNQNEMVFYPLDFGWVAKQIQAGVFKLSYYRSTSMSVEEQEKAPIVLTEKSEKLSEFLESCIAHPDAFKGEAYRYTFRKVPKDNKNEEF